jgi:hypothetical protein
MEKACYLKVEYYWNSAEVWIISCVLNNGPLTIKLYQLTLDVIGIRYWWSFVLKHTNLFCKIVDSDFCMWNIITDFSTWCESGGTDDWFGFLHAYYS